MCQALVRGPIPNIPGPHEASRGSDVDAGPAQERAGLVPRVLGKRLRADLRVPVHSGPHGRAVQVDPFRPTLKAPRTKRLTQKYDGLLSSFAFNFNLRRYTTVLARVRRFGQWTAKNAIQLSARADSPLSMFEAGAYTRPSFSST